MKRLLVYGDGWSVNIPADRVEREENVIFVFQDGMLEAMFDLGDVKRFYLSEKGDKDGIRGKTTDDADVQRGDPPTGTVGKESRAK